MDEICNPFNRTTSVNEESEKASGGGVRMSDVIVSLFTFIIPEIWFTREYSRVGFELL